jgi:hypothetical protein
MRYYEAHISTQAFGKEKVIKIQAKNEEEAKQIAIKKLPNGHWAIDYIARVLKQGKSREEISKILDERFKKVKVR